MTIEPSLSCTTANSGFMPKKSISFLPAQGSYARGVALCLLATIICGGMFPVMTNALRKIDPFTFTSLRYLIAGAAFLVLLRIKEGMSAFRLKGEPVMLAWFLGSVAFAALALLLFWASNWPSGMAP